MKKKNFILVLTFLCLWIGQAGFAQYNGDWEDFDTENDTINLPNLNIAPPPPKISGETIDEIYCSLYPSLCNNTNVPHYGGSNDPEDPYAPGNGGGGFSALPGMDQTGYNWSDNSSVETYNQIPSQYTDIPYRDIPKNKYGYVGNTEEIVRLYYDYNDGQPIVNVVSYGRVFAEEASIIRDIMNNVDIQDYNTVVDFARNNPAIGIQILHSYLAAQGNKELFATLVVQAMLAGLNPALAGMAPILAPRILQYYNYEYNRLKLEHPDWSELKLSATAALNVFQTGLDIVGMVPAAGEVADLINGGIYLIRGDLTNATISGLAVIPIGGQTFTGSRLVIKIVDGVAVPLAKGADEVAALVKFTEKIDAAITSLKVGARYIIEGTGAYKIVGGHHPMAKKAFEGVTNYNWRDAFSVSPSALDNASGITNTHSFITGQQNSLYSAWKNANPNVTMTIDAMANIEIQAMKNVGIPEDIAKGWVVKALEDLKSQGVDQIKNIPWNSINP